MDGLKRHLTRKIIGHYVAGMNIWFTPWVIPMVLFFYWLTGRAIGEQPRIWFFIWACCMQSTSDNMLVWIGLVKLFQIAYLRAIRRPPGSPLRPSAS